MKPLTSVGKGVHFGFVCPMTPKPISFTFALELGLGGASS
jgi:hypothetical protein